MHDYNAELSAVDDAMDMLQDYGEELSDIRAAAAFALTSLMEAVDRAVYHCQNALEDSRQTCDGEGAERRRTLQARLPDLEALQRRCALTGTALLDEWNERCAACTRLAGEGYAEAGRYLQKLNRIVGLSAPASAPVAAPVPSPTVHTVVLDSARYPQTAEHIRVAQNRGLPDVLTLDRSGAEERRRASLAGKAARTIYDRDEYPCAMFAEGGEGADVAYIEGGDNRGAGSALQWQLRSLPDGTKVRIRVI